MMAAAEAVAEAGATGGLLTGRKLVPWSSWAEWRFVRDSLFSPYPAAALRRATVTLTFCETRGPYYFQHSNGSFKWVRLVQIAAWRSRGSLPIPVDVTASFVEIRMRNPFFRYVV
jgi:ribosomal biogenesis protein LAS1